MKGTRPWLSEWNLEFRDWEWLRRWLDVSEDVSEELINFPTMAEVSEELEMLISAKNPAAAARPSEVDSMRQSCFSRVAATPASQKNVSRALV